LEEHGEKIAKFIGEVQDKFADAINVETRDWNTVKKIISFFIQNDDGTPIIDFIDEANWDSIESFNFNDSMRRLEITWHDFNDLSKPEEELVRTVFGHDIIKCMIKIDSITITANRGIPVLLIKPYYNDAKSINKEFHAGCSDINISRYRLFSVEVTRKVKKRIERISVPNINNFAVSIVPDCARFISVSDSKKLLYSYNLKVATNRCFSILKELSDIDDCDYEAISTKGNVARKYFESSLKILNLREEKQFEKDYQQLMLGDLIDILEEQSFENVLGLKKQDVVDILNKCSHDAGVHVTREEISKAILYIVGAINLS
jgi:hypothetical protein